MLSTFTDAQSGNSLAINPQHVVCVFTPVLKEGDTEVTVINLLNGNVAVKETYLDVVGRLQGALQ